MRVAHWAAEQKGQIATRQLIVCGLSHEAIRRRVAKGWLHPVYRGVYSVGHPVTTREARFMAAVLACGERAYLCRYCAGAHMNYLPWDERLPEVTVVGTSVRRVAGIRVHNVRSLHWRDTMRHDGIPVIAPARNLLDLATVLSPEALKRAARRAQANYHVSVRQMLEAAARCNGHRGVGPLRAVIAEGPTPSRSDLEDLVIDLLDRGGIPRPELNARLHFDGITIVPDCLWREQRVAIEADSERWHEHELTREHDADKQAILEADGWRVLRVDWQQTFKRPAQTLARIRAALGPLTPPP